MQSITNNLPAEPAKPTKLKLPATPESVINKVVTDLLEETVSISELQEITSYQARIPGKTLRPLLVLTFCNAVGGSDEDAIFAAAAMEILHTYSLLIDDIIDNARIRRDNLTTTAKYGTSQTLLAAVLHREAIVNACLKTAHPLVLLQLISKTVCNATEGEFLDLKYTLKDSHLGIIKNSHEITPLNEEEYLNIIRQKTADFVGLCCEVGVILGNGNSKQRKAARKFGQQIGIAYQIIDDIIDIIDPDSGKETGKDLIEGKLANYPLMAAMQKMDEVDRNKTLLFLSGKGNDPPGGLALVIELIKAKKGIGAGRKKIKEFLKKASKELNSCHFDPAEIVKLKILVNYLGNK